MSADDHRRTALDTLEREGARHVLARLLQDQPELRPDADRLVAELVATVGPEVIAADLGLSLELAL